MKSREFWRWPSQMSTSRRTSAIPASSPSWNAPKSVLEVTGSHSKICFEPLPQDDPKQRKPDIGKAKRLLGWEPKIDLRTGLQMSLEYFRSSLANRAAGS